MTGQLSCLSLTGCTGQECGGRLKPVSEEGEGMLLLSLFVTAKETCSGEREGERRRKREVERRGKERGRRQRGREIVLSKEISCLQRT